LNNDIQNQLPINLADVYLVGGNLQSGYQFSFSSILYNVYIKCYVFLFDIVIYN
jgi:hypothetical protein